MQEQYSNGTSYQKAEVVSANHIVTPDIIEDAADYIADWALPAHLAKVLHEKLDERSWREEIFGCEMLRNPTWEIILNVASAQLEGFPINVSSLYNFVRCPNTTVFRHIQGLESEGLLYREADPTDGRRHFLMLTEITQQRVVAYLERVIAEAS